MATIDTPCRVVIRVKVTDIKGDPLRRHVTLEQALCFSVLSRNFHNQIQPDGYDACCHVPPNFDSARGVCVYFVFDICVKGQAGLLSIPHFFYLASRARGNWKGKNVARLCTTR
jgi:hypothetical protein